MAFTFAGQLDIQAVFNLFGKGQVGIPVTVYLHGTTTLATLWTTKTKTPGTTTANPFVTTARAMYPELYVDPGAYDVILTVDGVAQPAFPVTVRPDPGEGGGGVATPAMLMYQSPSGFFWSTYDQVTNRILGDTTLTPACGKFTPALSTIVVDVDVEATGNYGGAWAPVILAVGVTSAAASARLFAGLSFPIGPAAGVTEFQSIGIGHFTIDAAGGMMHRRVFLAGLTPGREYTWQLYTGIEATSTQDALAASPNFGRMSVSPDNNWLAVSEWGANQVQIIRLGARPGWHFAANASPDDWPAASTASGIPELGQWYSSVGAPIPVGSQPVDSKFSPDGKTLAVGNFAGCSVTFIDVKTGTVIGNSAVLNSTTGATLNCLAWMKDSSGVLACTSTADYYYVTAVASPVVTHNGNFTSWVPQYLKRKDASTTDSFWGVGNVVTYPMVFATHTSAAALGAIIQVSPTPSSSTGRPAVAKDTGEIWIPLSGGSYAQQVMQVLWGANADGSLSHIGNHWIPHVGQNVNAVAIGADGIELWFWTVGDEKIGAIRTSDGALTQGLLAATGFESPPVNGQTATGFSDIVMSDDGYIYVSMGGSSVSWVHEWPGSTFTINTNALVSGNITVSAVGVSSVG